ncbi:MAG: pyruvate, phosphate dikinase [Actinobacteria bacterium]|nr:pyruvate, phosphate dikinase [Actinomycetota bacterium]
MAPSAPQLVYDFAEGSREMRNLLGGKGANVAEMTRLLGPELVPAGFTITAEACVRYLDADGVVDGLSAEVGAALARLEALAGRRLGDPADPLLVSVRSGARDSMPGMLDTVLNLGLNDISVEGLAARTGNERFAWDSYRRFVQMFGNVVMDIPGEHFEEAIAAAKAARGVTLDTDLDAAALRELVAVFRGLYDFPQDPRAQLERAINAVFDSWNGPRAVEYRRLHRIPDSWGTAVNVQQMVFGNKGETSGSGVAFSRDEITGAPEPSGDFLPNAQGEDVVSGVRTPRDLAELAEWMPHVHAQLHDILRRLERHYGDMQDTEFTIEEGRLYMLQTRNAKRPAQAAVRFAVDAVREGLLTRSQAIATIHADRLDALLHDTFDPAAPFNVCARGVAASPGAASGEIVLTAQEAVGVRAAGRDAILVRPFTEAEDVAGFHAAAGILTSEGGKASHAALVARGMGRPAVTGVDAMQVDLQAREVRIGDLVLRPGDRIAIDGSAGLVTTDDVPLVAPAMSEDFLTVLAWSDDLRTLGVRANADTPQAAAEARAFGAEGIGLCRSEHMFMDPERVPLIRRLVVALAHDGNGEREAALVDLRRVQQADFAGIFEAMAGLPVTVRLLDPPLHEFLPKPQELRAELDWAQSVRSADLPELLAVQEALTRLAEVNPMLGLRGVRLGLLYPDIYAMQIEAIFGAVADVRARLAEPPKVEIMVPLVAYESELVTMLELIDELAQAHEMRRGEDFTVGTMMELPRACLIADRIARHADFFSFGTNDLTQTTLGFSRDDVESAIVPGYVARNIIDGSPFDSIDEDGVGRLVQMGCELGRMTRPDLYTGICGEHGGDPQSIGFFHRAGVDYVSCSPFRVPIARVAAAQAAIAALDPQTLS